MTTIRVRRGVIGGIFCSGLLALAPAASWGAQTPPADIVDQGQSQQVQIQTSTETVRKELSALIDELDANGIGGDDVKTLRAIQGILGTLSNKDMDSVIQLLKQASAAADPTIARRDLTQAVVTQKTVVVKMRELLLTYQRQQELYDLSLRLEQLAERQNTNLKNLVSLARGAGKKSVSQYSEVEKSSLNLQDSEQASIRDEVGLLLSKLSDLAKESDAETADRLTKSIAQARQGKLEESLRGAAENLKGGLPYQAGSAEKNARDRLYDLARLVVPQQDAAATLKKAIEAVDKMIADEQRVAAQTAALDAKKPDAQKAADIEQQQGDLVDQSDRTRKDIEHLAPDAGDAIKDAQSHMQDTRSALIDAKPQRDKAAEDEKQSLAKLSDARKALDNQLAKELAKKPDGDAAAQAKALKEKIEQLKQAQIKLNDQTAAATTAAAPDRAKDQDGLAQQERTLEPEAAEQSLTSVADELGLARGDMTQAEQSLNARHATDAQAPQKSAVDHLTKAEALLDQRLAQLDQEKKDLEDLEKARDKVAKLIVDEHKVAQATEKAAAKEKPKDQANADKPAPATQEAQKDQKPPATQEAQNDQKPPTSQPADKTPLADKQSQVAQQTDQTKKDLPDAGKEASAPLNDAQQQMTDAANNLNQQNAQNAQQPQQEAMTDLGKAKDALDKKIADLQKDLGQPPDQNTDLADLNQQLQQAQQELADAQQQMADAQNQQSLQEQQQQLADALKKAAQQEQNPQQQQATQEAQQDAQKAADALNDNKLPDAISDMQKAEKAMQQAQQANPQQPDMGKLADQQKAIEQATKQMADEEKAAEEMAKAAEEMAKIGNDLTQAAQDQGIPESAKQAMQDATKALDKGSAAADAGKTPDAQAQAQAQQAQEALSQAQAAVALAQQGMKMGKSNKSSAPGMAQAGPPDSGGPPDNTPGHDDMGQSEGNKSGIAHGGGQDTVGGQARNGDSVLLSLPPRDRAAYQQTEKEKYPAEYDRIMEQYLKNVSDQESKQQ